METKLISFRFVADDLRFHLKSGNFLGQAEIVSILSPTQSNSEKLGPSQCRFSLGLSTEYRLPITVAEAVA